MNKNLLILLLVSVSSNVFGSLARCTNDDDGSEFFFKIFSSPTYFSIFDKNTRQEFDNCNMKTNVNKPNDRIITFFICDIVSTLINTDNPKETYADFSSLPTSLVLDTTKKNGKFKGATTHLMWNYNSYEVNPSDADTEKATCIRE